MIPFPKPLRPIFAIMAFLVFLLAGVIGGSDAVMCYGSDGHVALESLGSSGCSDFVQHSAIQSAAFKTSVRNDHCRGCQDIPLFSVQALPMQKIWSGNKLTLEKQMLVWVESVFIVPTYPDHWIAYQMAQPPPTLKPPVHKYLNSVILLI